MIGSDAFDVIAKLAGLTFVVGSMLAMGTSLTLPQILSALSNRRLMLFAIVANFVIAPALAYGLAAVFKLDTDLRTGLIIVGAAAGAPFLPRLVQIAGANIALGVGLMVALMILTIIYLPLALPLLLGGGVHVNAWDIAKSLIFLMLLPLAFGLFVKARHETLADVISPIASRVSTVAVGLLLVLMFVLNIQSILGIIGTGGIAAALVFLAGTFVIGYVLGGRSAGSRAALALATAQRNISAALVVAAQNFGSHPNVLVMVMVVAVIGLIALGLAAGELGRTPRRRLPAVVHEPDQARRPAEKV